jgi:hypothetical protein
LQPQQKSGGAWQFCEQEIPKRYEASQGGAGGHHWSLQWPEKSLAGQRLRLWAARTAEGQLRFAASHLYGPGATWWEAECALPQDLAAKPLCVLAVRTVRETSAADKWTEPLDPAQGYGASMPAGVLRWVRVRPLGAGQSPQPPVFAEADLPKAWMLKPADGEVHPSLFGTAEVLRQVRARLGEPRWQGWRGLLVKQAELAEDLNSANRIGVQLSSCVWAWTLTGETAARDHALELVDRLTTATDSLPHGEHDWPGRRRQTIELDEFACHAVEGLATTYDLLHHELGAARRRAVLRVLHRGLDYYRERTRGNDWWYANNPSNTIGVAAGCHGIGALALRELRPQDVDEVLERAVQAIKERYRGIADDGGCREGTLYWQYGGMYPLVFGLALERATGDSRGILDLPRFRHAGDYARVILGGDGEMTCFNDTQPWLNGLLPLAVCGGRHGDPLCLWLTDRMAGLTASDSKRPLVGDQRNAGPALLLRGATFAPESFPGVPTLAKLDSIAEGVLRSDGGEIPRLLVAVKGNGQQNTHHANHDQGSITLAARGETLLIDPGYYEGNADCHSLPLPAGADLKAWNPRAPAPLSETWEDGAIRTMTVDASAAAKTLGMTRQRRIVTLIGDRAAVLLDDLAPEGSKRRMQTQFQCGFPVELAADRRTARVQGLQGGLLVTADAPGLQFADAPRRKFGKDWIYAQRDQAWHPLRGEWDCTADVPCIAVLQPVAAGAKGGLVRVERAADRVTVHAGGTSLQFARGADGVWQLSKPSN